MKIATGYEPAHDKTQENSGNREAYTHLRGPFSTAKVDTDLDSCECNHESPKREKPRGLEQR